MKIIFSKLIASHVLQNMELLQSVFMLYSTFYVITKNSSRDLSLLIILFQRTMPQDLYGRTKGPGMGPRPGMEEMDFSDDDATPLTEPIYSGRYVITYCMDMQLY